MWRNLLDNLSKEQKIIGAVLIQVVVIILIIATVSIGTSSEPVHVTTESGESEEIMQNIPDDSREIFNKQLWNVVSSLNDGLDSNKVDYSIREDTYEEVCDDGACFAKFLIDVDEVRQTYTVSISWDEDSKVVVSDGIIINCPKQSEMKYPDTRCRGMYNDTYSLDLYLPYVIDAPHNPDVWDVYIETDGTRIYVDVEDCNPEKLKQQAMDYLNSIPVDLSEYEIVYEINNLEYPYYTGEMSQEEVEALDRRCNNE